MHSITPIIKSNRLRFISVCFEHHLGTSQSHCYYRTMHWSPNWQPVPTRVRERDEQHMPFELCKIQTCKYESPEFIFIVPKCSILHPQWLPEVGHFVGGTVCALSSNCKMLCFQSLMICSLDSHEIIRKKSPTSTVVCRPFYLLWTNFNMGREEGCGHHASRSRNRNIAVLNAI